MIVASYYPPLYKCVCYISGNKVWQITVNSLREAYKIKETNEKENKHGYPGNISVTIMCIQKVKEIKEV